MLNTLSIRSYNRDKQGHQHGYHQLVLPLSGVINIDVSGFTGKVAPGECVVIREGQVHHFTAETEAKFVVADMTALPDNLKDFTGDVFTINLPMSRYLNFIEAQLHHQVNADMHSILFQTFVVLLSEQQLLKQFDRRIKEVIEFIDLHLAEDLSIVKLASIAYLSATQFKKLFRAQTNETAMTYITRLRMEKAKALLLHSDYSIQIVANTVGYSDLAAFSRRFKQFYGVSPSKLYQ
ncbi:AraC family transcriptional regulator [Vibrio sp.]|nr:AraC family transcriptional regulator [Vibrio sp.]